MVCSRVGEVSAFIDTIEVLRRQEIIEEAEIQIKYAGYIEREEMLANRLAHLEHVTIKGKIDYEQVTHISTEARQKLMKIDPETLGQASRIPGISPSDIQVLLLLLQR